MRSSGDRNQNIGESEAMHKARTHKSIQGNSIWYIKQPVSNTFANTGNLKS